MKNASRLREWRALNGLDQKQVAAALSEIADRNVDQTTVSRYENGERIPTRVIMAAIRELTKGVVTADDFHDSATDAAVIPDAQRRGKRRGHGATEAA